SRRLSDPGDRVVLGPAADGGYYLIGLTQFHRRLVEKIDGSTDRVFRQTLARAAEIGVAVATLPEWYDVDDEATLAMLAGEIGPLRTPESPYRNGYRAPHTTAFLKKWGVEKGGSERLFARVEPPPFPLPRARKG